jgi:DNA-binding MarR family transcriptional regulator
LITRRQDESDRRQLHIEITPTGRDLLIRDAHEQDKWLAAAMTSSMTSVERELLSLGARLLESLADVDPFGNPGGKSDLSSKPVSR